MNKANETIGGASILFVVGGLSKKILYISIQKPILEKIFKCGSMPFGDFCQNFINNYHVPEIKGKTYENGYSEMSYRSPQGWMITFIGSDAGVSAVELLSIPTVAKQGFGK